MATYVQINNALYPATIKGYTNDSQWEDRQSKVITLKQPYSFVESVFTNDTEWKIVEKTNILQTVVDENNNLIQTTKEVEKVYDNSDYCVAGPITDHRDGTVSVRMGKPLPLEQAYELLYGGI